MAKSFSLIENFLANQYTLTNANDCSVWDVLYNLRRVTLW
ncbi:hypothetical protein VCHENC01_3675 [Vibrio harveyi]|nr:hypothetical protein VCHENC01_3675 [Vibrio harveyi]